MYIIEENIDPLTRRAIPIGRKNHIPLDVFSGRIMKRFELSSIHSFTIDLKDLNSSKFYREREKLTREEAAFFAKSRSIGCTTRCCKLDNYGQQ